MPTRAQRRRRQRAAASRRPPTVQEVNKKCKSCLLRYSILISIAVGLMSYFVPYEQPNVPFRAPQLQDSDITVMSYNVRGSNLDSGNTTAWQARRTVALEMLRLYQPDLIGLQETQRNQLETFKQLGYGSYGKFIPTSILYNRTKFRFLDGDTLWLSQTPSVEQSVSWDASQQRTVTWILVTTSEINHACNTDTTGDDIDDVEAQCETEDIEQTKSYLIFNTHLDHEGEASRMESCLVIKDVIHEISTVKYKDAFPVFLTGDFNVAKYSNVWQCFTENEHDSFELKDALHSTRTFAPWYSLQLQYTYHHFLGLHMNTWYMRGAQYLFFGFSNSVVKWLRNVCFRNVCCMAPSLYRQIYRRKEYDRNAGIHHLDWILYHSGNDKIEQVQYFEVISYHRVVEETQTLPIAWNLKGVYDGMVAKTVYPSDHFPIIAGFRTK